MGQAAMVNRVNVSQTSNMSQAAETFYFTQLASQCDGNELTTREMGARRWGMFLETVLLHKCMRTLKYVPVISNSLKIALRADRVGACINRPRGIFMQISQFHPCQ